MLLSTALPTVALLSNFLTIVKIIAYNVFKLNR
jgi:hypothetical protein